MIVLNNINDLVPVDFLQDGEVAFTLLFKPITQGKKIVLAKKMQGLNQEDLEAVMDSTKSLIQSCLHGIEGVQNSDGSQYELEMKNGKITDECFEQVLELPMIDKVFTVAGLFLRSTPNADQELLDMSGEIVQGVKVKKRVPQPKN